MPDPTKDEMSEALNGLLNTDIDWTRLLKKDLKKIVTLFSEPDELLKQLQGDEQGLRVDINNIRGSVKQLLEGWEGPMLSNVREATDTLKSLKKEIMEELEGSKE